MGMEGKLARKEKARFSCIERVWAFLNRQKSVSLRAYQSTGRPMYLQLGHVTFDSIGRVRLGSHYHWSTVTT
jgi:hypothetical protein